MGEKVGEKVGKKKAIPRPPNSFMLWGASNRNIVKQRHPYSTNADISRVLGKEWNKMPANKKQQWQILAEEAKLSHSTKYPDYKYQPKTSRPKPTKPKTSKPKNISNDDFIDEFSLFQCLIELYIY